MKKIILLMLFISIGLFAVEKESLFGEWNSITKSINNGSTTIEKEHINFKANKYFNITLLVSVEKNDAFIKDLQIDVRGMWEVSDNTLVLVVQQVNVPIVQEVNKISQASINALAANFKAKYQSEPIHILKIKFINKHSLIVLNKTYKESSYSR